MWAARLSHLIDDLRGRVNNKRNLKVSIGVMPITPMAQELIPSIMGLDVVARKPPTPFVGWCLVFGLSNTIASAYDERIVAFKLQHRSRIAGAIEIDTARVAPDGVRSVGVDSRRRYA